MLFTLSILDKCDTSTIQLGKIVTKTCKRCYYLGVPAFVTVEKQIPVPICLVISNIRRSQDKGKTRQTKI